MYKNKKFLAIIPARSGSKGIEDKNIKDLNGKPLIAYSIEAAIKASIFDDIIVSTDSVKYAEVAKAFGASVPFIRSSELAQDNSSSIDVIAEVIEKLKHQEKEYDYFALLQPTSPLRTAEDIKGCINRLFELEADSIISMCECEHPIEWSTKFDDEKKCLKKYYDLSGRRQDKKISYRLNGAIYLVSVDYFLKKRNLYSEASYAYIMSKEHSIDIDDIYDFKCAESFIKLLNK